MLYKDYFPIIDYYKKVIVPVDRNRFFLKSDKMMVCPLHADVNPSMGVIKGSDGDEIYHCFGCGSWGNVVDLHKRVSKILFKRYLSEEDALKDLCKIFSVSYEVVQDKKVNQNSDERRFEAIERAVSKFDVSDFREAVIKGKLERKSIGYFNTMFILMIDSIKGSENNE